MTSHQKLHVFGCACLFLTLTYSPVTFGSNAGSGLPRMPVTTPNRSVFLNGVDISSARNQDLRNVHIKITENGDIFIAAPQYQVTEEETFMPLSSYTSKSAPPEHKTPQSIKDTASPISARSLDRTPAETTKALPAKADTSASPSLSQPASTIAPKSGG